MLFGVVGQSCWQTPQPMQPKGLTATSLFLNSMAAVPRGQWSTQIEQSWPKDRTQDSCRQTAVPMSMSLIDVGTNAPLGQTCMQYKPSQTTQGMVSTSI